MKFYSWIQEFTFTGSCFRERSPDYFDRQHGLYKDRNIPPWMRHWSTWF